MRHLIASIRALLQRVIHRVIGAQHQAPTVQSVQAVLVQPAPTETITPSRTQLAFHEAGHAVAAFTSGILVPCGPITVEHGRAELELQFDERAVLQAMAEGTTQRELFGVLAVSLAAGGSAERRYLRDNGLPVDEADIVKGMSCDQALFDEVRKKSESALTWEQAVLAAEGLVAMPQRWDLISMFATDLDTLGTMTPEQAKAALVAAARRLGA